MKLSFLTCAFALILSVSSAAQAATISPTEDQVSGSLAKYTEITFTYTSNGTSPGPFITASGSESLDGVTASGSSTSHTANSSQSTSQTINIDGGMLTVLTTAAFKGTSIVTIENLTGFKTTYDILLAATNLAKAGSFTISSISPAPIPTSAIMFLTALIGLGLFAKMRKPQTQEINEFSAI